MQHETRFTSAFFGIALSLFVAGCGADDTPAAGRDGGQTGPDGAGASAQLDALDEKAFAEVAQVYDILSTKASQVWNESANGNVYEMHKMPLYLVRRDANRHNVKGYLLSHSAPPPGATAVAHASLSQLGTVYRYDAALSAFGREQHFEFDMDIGGVKTYVFPYSSEDDGTSPNEPGFFHFLVHEGFHRYQMLEGGWSEPAGWVQSDESTYPLTSEFVALILLEDKILLAGIDSPSASKAKVALEQLVAVRSLRASLSESTVSGVNVVTHGDNGQEWNEGTPTYVERAISLAGGIAYDMGDINSIGGRVSMSLIPGVFSSKADAKSYFASARQYGSGGAIAVLLDQVGGVDWRSACKAGKTPFDSAKDTYNLSQSEMSSLVQQAKTAHGYDVNLVPRATTIAGLP